MDDVRFNHAACRRSLGLVYIMNLALPLIVVLPFVAGVGLLVARRGQMSEKFGESVGLITVCVTLFLALLSGMNLLSGTAAEGNSVIHPSLEFSPSWLALRLPSMTATHAGGWQLSLGLDGIGLSMVMLTAIVSLAVLLISQTTVTHHRSDFGAWILLAMSGLMLVFLSMDLILFYVGFELTLVPVFALIAHWGDKDASVAAKRFVLYTLAGSIPMVIGVLGIALLYNGDGWTASLPELSKRAAAQASNVDMTQSQAWVFGFLVLGLGIKMALLPVHTWLPKTYGSSHPTAAAFLAAVVLKLGLFGFVRLALPMLPLACETYGPPVMGLLGAVAIVVGALMALAQTDILRLLAYSSLSHVGFVTMGLFSLNAEGINGGVLQMFNHGITTAAMFLVVSCLIARRGTPKTDLGSLGLASRYPHLAAFMIFFTAAGAGVPGLNNFAGETLTLTAMIAKNPAIAAIGVLGVILGAWYSFRLVQGLLLGQDEPDRKHDVAELAHRDISAPEKSVFACLALICLVIGVYPQLAIDVIKRDANQLGEVVDTAQKSLALHSSEQQS
jgi:NADH-quinone oxidoreductase subunit M